MSGNAKHGILIDEPNDLVQGNRVGTDISGTVAVPNGTGGGGPWAGIAVRGPSTVVGGTLEGVSETTLGEANLVSGNTALGILVGPGSAFSEVHGNLVGAANDGDAPLGNGSHGIVVVEQHVLVGLGSSNVVLDNGGDGIHVESGSGGEVAWVMILHNMIGEGLLAGVHGNGGDGISLVQGTSSLHDNDVRDNWVQSSGGVGIRVDGRSGDVRSTGRSPPARARTHARVGPFGVR